MAVYYGPAEASGQDTGSLVDCVYRWDVFIHFSYVFVAHKPMDLDSLSFSSMGVLTVSQSNPQNPLAFLGPIPGMVNKKIETISTSDGVVYGRTTHKITTIDQSGMPVTENGKNQPTLACGHVPGDLHEVFVCVCSRPVCKSCVSVCQICNMPGCFFCVKKVSIENREILICEKCLLNLNTPKIIKAVLKVKGLIYGNQEP